MTGFVAGPSVSNSLLVKRQALTHGGQRAQRGQGRRGAVVLASTNAPQRVLVIGGTRFSGLYLTKALADQGHEVVLYNRGNKKIGDPSLMTPGETEAEFSARNQNTKVIVGDRTDADDMIAKLKNEDFDVIFDNNGRELSDSKPLIDLFKDRVKQYVYMSSAGVYRKSEIMPHVEGDDTDPNCRHKGKLHTEAYLQEQDMPYTSIRPTYIYGALNYNPLEEWFFERINAGRPVPVPGTGLNLTGLGHVQDLANAMASVVGNDKAIQQVYNIQDRKAITFDGMVRECAKAAGKDPESIPIVHYNPKDFDFGKKKAFPMRPQHFFTSVDKALADLDWDIRYDTADGLRDSFVNDFTIKISSGGLKNDFSTDDMVLEKLAPHLKL